jgi:hypothetical protein
MKEKKHHTKNLSARSILSEITNTLLYEGYSIFPYHRSAIKNQKPIPFGVVYPRSYNSHNPHFPAEMRSECIVCGSKIFSVHITICFLHLLKTNNDGWQTVERRIETENIITDELLINSQKIPFYFNGENENEILPIRGEVVIKTEAIENIDNAFKISANVINNSLSADAKNLSRDEALRQSFLSTHIILTATSGEFISSQDPPEKFGAAIAQCKNVGAWPILIGEENTTMLCSPIIVYDHPEIHPQSKTDLFDSTEIEEALMLHFAAMSDEEKNNIANSDEKLRAMFNKVSEVTPQEMIGLHGGMKYK